MGAYEDLLQNYVSAASQSLPPITREAAEAFELSEPSEVDQLGMFLARAFMAGANAGEAEVMAQAAEQGLEFEVTQLRAPE